MSKTITPLWLALDVPELPLIALGLADRPEAWILTSAAHVVSANRAATKLGIVPGMTSGAAQALGDVHLQACDTIAERKTLDALAAWSMQFTSHVSLRPPTGLLLEIGRSLTLFKGLQALIAAFRTGLRALGYTGFYAVAPTPLAAYWFARVRQSVCITGLSDLAAPLADLPIDLLATDERMQETFHGLGLSRIADCLQLPRAGLAQRFGPSLVNVLDRALGRQADLQIPYDLPEYFERRVELLYEVDKAEALQALARPWLEELAGFLRARAAGTQQLAWQFFHRDQQETAVHIVLTSVSRDPQHWEKLLSLHLEQTQLPAPVRAIRLSVTDLQSVPETNLTLFPEDQEHAQSSGVLLERLRARLGSEAVCGLCLVEDYRPEAAWRYCLPGTSSRISQHPARPLWLLPTPEGLSSRQGRPYRHGLLQPQGRSERIESGWWDGQAIARDYFIAEQQGKRYWVFREVEGDRRWFIHGLFD